MPCERSSKSQGKRRQRSTSPFDDCHGASTAARDRTHDFMTIKREDHLFFGEDEEEDELEDEEGALPDDRFPIRASNSGPMLPTVKMEVEAGLDVKEELEEGGALPDDRSHTTTCNTAAEPPTVKKEYIVISDDEDELDEANVHLDHNCPPAVAAVTPETGAPVTTVETQDHVRPQQIVEIDSVDADELCPTVTAAGGHPLPQEQPEVATSTDDLARQGATAQEQAVPSDNMDVVTTAREEQATVPSVETPRPDTTTNRIVVRIPEALQARAARRTARRTRAPSAVRVSIRNEYEDAIRANLKKQAELWLYGQMTEAKLGQLRHELSHLQNQYEQHRVAQYMHEYYLRHPNDVHPTTARAIREAYLHHRHVFATPRPSTQIHRTHYAVVRLHGHDTGTITTMTYLHPFLPPA